MLIKSIKIVAPETVYAIQTESGNYVSDGLAHHNCRICNRTLGGNYKVYEPKISCELGQDTVLKMWDEAYRTDKIPTITLEKMLVEIKRKIVQKRS